MDFYLFGWSSKVDVEYRPYFNRKNELTVAQGCVMWGNRVIIPEKLREKILEELHGSHLGMVKMKSLARSYVWWPKLDAEIKTMIKSCTSSLTYNAMPKPAPIKAWDLT